jgi:hypothetical protein
MPYIGVGLGLPFANGKPKFKLFDSFTRPDSLDVGKAETGQTYFQSGLGKIVSNKLQYQTPNSSGQYCFVGAISVAGNIRLTADFYFQTNSGLFIRYADVTNYFILRFAGSALGLYKVINGSATNLGGCSSSSGYNSLKIEVIRNVINCYLNGVLVITVTDTALNTAITHGIRIQTPSGGLIDTADNLLIEEL